MLVLTSVWGRGELYEDEFKVEHLLLLGAEPDVGPDTLLHSFVSSSGLNGQFSSQLRSGDRLGAEPNSGSRILFSKAWWPDAVLQLASCCQLWWTGLWGVLMWGCLTCVGPNSCQEAEPEGGAEGRSRRAEPRGGAGDPRRQFTQERGWGTSVPS